MSSITTALTVATALFGATMTLAVLVKGFFIGRSWLRRMDAGSSDPEGGIDMDSSGQGFWRF